MPAGVSRRGESGPEPYEGEGRPVAKFGDGGELLEVLVSAASRQKQVKKLIAGPGVYICDECIDLCNEIIEEELSRELGGPASTSCRSPVRSTSS